MPGLPLAEKVLVSIVSVIVQASPPAWRLEYEVRNLGGAAIWLVVGESLSLRRDESHIELSYARGKMQSDVHVFGYFNPNVVSISPGKSLRRPVEIIWPCPLSDIWNIERVAAPSPGEYEVSVRVGYATTDTPEPPRLGEDVEAPVLRWQNEVVSLPMRITIPPYLPTH